MKKILFSVFCGMALFVSSCSNDDIIIDAVNKAEVNVNVNLSNFFSSYNFNDTQHGVNISEEFRTFYSEYNKYIQVRTLFYNSTGLLVDSVISYSTSTNAVTQKIALPEGTYTAITTLTFADKDDDDANVYYSWWDLCDKERLSTVYLNTELSRTRWAIMSYASQTISVDSESANSFTMTPQPIGALCYIFFQNFQYKNEATYGNVADNGIRSLSLYTQKLATGFRLNPDASEKYIYKEDAGENTWWFLSSYMEPSDFSQSSEYGYFRTNLYSFCYILAPKFNMYFGYEMKNEDYFNGYGLANYSITNGKTYLAYWDWFKVGNPYFGVATNSKWNKYE